VPVGADGQELLAWPPDARVLGVFPLRLTTADPWTSTDGAWAPPLAIAPLAGAAVPTATASPSPTR